MIQKTKVINVTATIDGEELSGAFTVKRLSVMDQVRMNTLTAQLCGGLHCVREEKDGMMVPTGQGIDPYFEYYAHAVSFLKTAIVDAPAWWDLESIADREVVISVYRRVSEFALNFRPGIGREADPQSSAGAAGEVVRLDDRGGAEGSGQKRQRADEDGSPAAVVVRKVSSALDV